MNRTGHTLTIDRTTQAAHHADRQRRSRCVLVTLAALSATAALAAPAAHAALPPPTTLGTTNAEQAYTVPVGVTAVHVDAVGGAGGSYFSRQGDQLLTTGGVGAHVSGDLQVSAGQTLFVEVGGIGGNGGLAGTGAGGFNGGGSGFVGGGAGGGGASDIRLVSSADPGSLESRLLVAAGGGGAGAGGVNEPGGAGGNADNAGQDATSVNVTPGQNGLGGAAGRPTIGGAGGGARPDCQPAQPGGGPGVLGVGGTGTGAPQVGGGAGGGWYGGGGGSGCANSGGGGGGSSNTAPAITNTMIGLAAAGSTPSITITPISSSPPPPAPPPPAAKALLTPTMLSFGAHTQGTASKPQTVTITNAGTGPLTLTNVSFAGANPADFYITSTTCTMMLSTQASCQVSVGFDPQAAGQRTASLVVASNDPATPTATVALSGTGTAPASGQGKTKILLVTCTPRHHKFVCKSRIITGPLSMTSSSMTTATLTRGQLLLATGVQTMTPGGGMQLRLKPKRRVAGGVYTLTLAQRHGRHWHTQHTQITMT